MNDLSFLEQNTIVKGGAGIIIGNCSEGNFWNKLVLNTLLIQCVKSQKYKKIVIICGDVKISEILLLIKISCLQHHIESERIILVNNVKEFSTNFQSNEDGLAVFHYSFSETLLNEAFQDEIALLRKFLYLCAESLSEKHQVQTSKLSPMLYLTYLHVSFHDTCTVAALNALFPTNILVVPNYGTMSTSMAVQIQTVRRSYTNKIQENVEMFGFHKSGVTLNLLAAKSETVKQESKSLVQGDVLLQSALMGNSEKPVEQSVAINPRLITFESTDPEFDEDSDPDADLDL
jgi:hypothetical protein